MFCYKNTCFRVMFDSDRREVILLKKFLLPMHCDGDVDPGVGVVYPSSQDIQPVFPSMDWKVPTPHFRQ